MLQFLVIGGIILFGIAFLAFDFASFLHRPR